MSDQTPITKIAANHMTTAPTRMVAANSITGTPFNV